MAGRAPPPFVRLFLPGSREWVGATAEPGFSANTQGQNTFYSIDLTSPGALRILDAYISNMGREPEDSYMRNVFNFANSHNPKIRLLHPMSQLERKVGTPNAFRLKEHQFRGMLLQSRAIDENGQPKYNTEFDECNPDFPQSGLCHCAEYGFKLPFPVCAVFQQSCGNCQWLYQEDCSREGTAVCYNPHDPWAYVRRPIPEDDSDPSEAFN